MHNLRDFLMICNHLKCNKLHQATRRRRLYGQREQLTRRAQGFPFAQVTAKGRGQSHAKLNQKDLHG
jgi:hypothetical protein